MVKKAELNEIDRVIKQIWKNNIRKDYRSDYLLKEDTLKNSFYYHLRRKLGIRFLESNDIRIFTEFSDGELKGTGSRADIAVVKMSKTRKEYYLGDNVEAIIAIIELKFSRGSDGVFYADIGKIRDYIRVQNINCLYYLGFIAEKVYDNPNWLDGRQTRNWADKKVAVLSANYESNGDGRMVFHIQSCNGLNKDMDSRE